MIADDPTLGYNYGYENGENDAWPPTTIARVWAPDYIIKQVAGPLIDLAIYHVVQIFLNEGSQKARTFAQATYLG